LSGENLTRIEAEERSSLLEVSNYRVELDLSGSDTEVYWSGTRVNFTSNRTGATTFIDAMARELTRVTLNGVDLNPAEVYDGYRITLASLSRVTSWLLRDTSNTPTPALACTGSQTLLTETFTSTRTLSPPTVA